MDAPQAGGSRHSAGLCSLVPGGQTPSGAGPGAASAGHRALGRTSEPPTAPTPADPAPSSQGEGGRQTKAPPGARAERGWGALPGSPRPSWAKQHLWLVLRGCGSSPAEGLPGAHSATRCDPARPAGSRHHRPPRTSGGPRRFSRRERHLVLRSARIGQPTAGAA